MKKYAYLALLLFLCGCSRSSVTPTPSSNLFTGDFTGCAVGAFVNGMENLSSFQAMAGKNLVVVNWYIQWEESFPSADADQVSANGSAPLITWEPSITNAAGTLEAIASGSYETYVRTFFQAAKAWGKPLFLRFGHEMNGNWYAWDGYHNGGSTGPQKYKSAWQYIYNVRQSVGASNVYLVFCANNWNIPGDSWNTIAAYYPGDAYVDWVALDGYNWGRDNWQSFDAVFGTAYQTLTNLTAKPLMISEFSSDENGGSKAAWITETFSKIKGNYPRIKLFSWFNINKERDWRVNSSASAEAAYKSALQDAYFLGTI